MSIRADSEAGATALAGIYAHWAEHSVATFDTVAPAAAHRVAKVAACPVLLVVEEAGVVRRVRDPPGPGATAPPTPGPSRTRSGVGRKHGRLLDTRAPAARPRGRMTA